jgi:hypothetical protein
MSRVTLTEHSTDPDVTDRTGHATPTELNTQDTKVRVTHGRDACGDLTVTVESGALELDALWFRATAALDEWVSTRRIAALEPDAVKGHALRQKKQSAGRQSGEARRAKNKTLRDAVATLRCEYPGIRYSQLASSLFAKYGRPSGDRVKDVRALAKRIARLDQK